MRKVQVKKHKINGAVSLSVHKEVLVSRIKISYAFVKKPQGDSLASFLDFGIKNFYSYETAKHFKMIYF